jgi:hypothetical protein
MANGKSYQTRFRSASKLMQQRLYSSFSHWSTYNIFVNRARSQRDGRPKPKVIPDPLPLDRTIALRLLEIVDSAFLSSTSIRPADLTRQIAQVTDTVRPSFERSGLVIDSSSMTGAEFNFVAYIHFKAFSDLVNLSTFNKKTFESKSGQDIVDLLLPKSPTGTNSDKKSMLQSATNQLNTLCERLVSTGLVARIDEVKIDPDQIDDWSDDLSDLSWTVALDGDITLQAQCLLQEQGIRIYPAFGRTAIQALLGNLQGQKVIVDDYYFDTDYNSDPDKFLVKEVLLNIVLENE